MSYLNYDEIVASLHLLSQAYPTVTELLRLPNVSVEKRSIFALRIGRMSGRSAKTATIVGGLHAQEWVPPDALINLCADLLEASSRGTGLGYGASYFDHTVIESILANLHLVVLPCANPDGRVYSQTIDPEWRKNRARFARDDGTICYGVDLNRNFDIAWDFQRHFASGFAHASTNPCAYIYVGPEAASEPETRNIVWLLDQFSGTRWYVDVHSYAPAVLHSWGIDENQYVDAGQNFLNPDYDGMRGIPWDSAYREFIEEPDLREAIRLSTVMSNACRLVHGVDYAVREAFSFYGTPGASDDYVYGRHRMNPMRAPVLSFTLECGHEFQPDLATRENVIREVTAALIAFASDVAGQGA